MTVSTRKVCTTQVFTIPVLLCACAVPVVKKKCRCISISIEFCTIYLTISCSCPAVPLNVYSHDDVLPSKIYQGRLSLSTFPHDVLLVLSVYVWSRSLSFQWAGP